MDSNHRKRNQKAPFGAAIPPDSALCVEGASDSEQRGTGANGGHLTLVGGTDRDRLALRAVAASALGFIEGGDCDSAARVLREFLRRERALLAPRG